MASGFWRLRPAMPGRSEPRPRLRKTPDLLSAIPSLSSSRLGRVGVPDDIGRVVLFCASDMSIFMTGSTLLVDAGELA